MGSIFMMLAMLADPLSGPCHDDNMTDRCSPKMQAEMRDLYRVPPIEAYVGSTVRRIFFVDGYGNDTVAIEFIRAPEKDPTVRVHFPKAKEEPPIAPIEQLLSAEQWQQLIAASQNFDKQFAPEVNPKRTSNNPGSEQEIVLCIHSWVYWAEAADAGAKPRSTVNDACNDAPVEQFAGTAARIAIGTFPFCNAIDPKLSRNDATRLRSCSRLSGDRLTAASVFNDAEAFRFIDRDGLERLTAYDFELDFQGSKTKGDEAKAFWQSLVSNERSPHFYYRRIQGLSATKAIVSGALAQETDGDQYQIADVEMRWESEGGTFNLKSMKVGAYRPHVFLNE